MLGFTDAVTVFFSDFFTLIGFSGVFLSPVFSFDLLRQIKLATR